MAKQDDLLEAFKKARKEGDKAAMEAVGEKSLQLLIEAIKNDPAVAERMLTAIKEVTKGKK